MAASPEPLATSSLTHQRESDHHRERRKRKGSRRKKRERIQRTLLFYGLHVAAIITALLLWYLLAVRGS
jgi:hypothetical protein